MFEITLRPYETSDFDRVRQLWSSAGLHPSQSDTSDGLARKQERDPELFILATTETMIVGSVMGSYDGRRGWINKLAVRPEFLGMNIGVRLLAEVELRLKALGCQKVNLLIEHENAKVVSYYERLGYATDPLIFMEKWLD